MPRTSPRLGKKRSIDQEEEATTTTKSTMWGSKKKRSQASSSSPAAATSTSNTNSSGLNTSAVEQMFAEIADPDDPQTANMEGTFARNKISTRKKAFLFASGGTLFLQSSQAFALCLYRSFLSSHSSLFQMSRGSWFFILLFHHQHGPPVCLELYI